MSRLDGLISDKGYELECLKVFRDIINSGNCNTCGYRECKYKPKLGELIRYNCPFYKENESR